MKRLWVFLAFLLLLFHAKGQDTTINVIEYFFDSDPGYGAGTSIAITPGTVVNAMDMIPTGPLSLGFHVLYIRAQDEHGKWGIPEGVSTLSVRGEHMCRDP